MAVMSLYMAEVELLAELELVVRLVVWLVQMLQEEVQSQGRQGWMRKIRVDHNKSHASQQCDLLVDSASMGSGSRVLSLASEVYSLARLKPSQRYLALGELGAVCM